MCEFEFVQIFGERNSGTNFLDQLLRSNVTFERDRVLGSTDQRKNPFGHKFGFKHWFVDDALLKQPEAERTLFLAVFRDPWFWVRSMAQRPYQAVRHKGVPVSRFLRQEWYAEEGGQEMMVERDPATGERFPNLLKLRSAKIEDLLALEGKVQHFHWVRYEDLMFGAQPFLRDLSAAHPGLLKPDLTVRQRKKDRLRLWLKRQNQRLELCRLFGAEDRQFIRAQLDRSLEQRLGYQL